MQFSKIAFLKKIDAVVGSALVRLLPGLPCREYVGSVESILIIRPGGIGDAVLLLPVIDVLRRHFPTATICVLAEKRNWAVFELCQNVDRTWCYDNWRHWRQFFLRRYDVVIDTEQWYHLSAVISRCISARIRCGFATNIRRRAFSVPVAYSLEDYEMDNFLRLVSSLGAKVASAKRSGFACIACADERTATQLLAPVGDRPFVVLFPGGSSDIKQWQTAAFNAVAARCRLRGYAVVIVGGGSDVASAESIAASGVSVNLAGRMTLSQTAAVLNRAVALVGGDSGVLHLAVAVGCPTVALFGPGSTLKWAPRGSQHRVVSLGLKCSPCTLFGHIPPCPHGGRCVKDIPVEMVWKQLEELLDCAGE